MECLKVREDQLSASRHLEKICLIGYPCDEGVKRNGGRLGAQRGPHSFRQIWTNPVVDNVEFCDFGNILVSTESLEETHVNLLSRVKSSLQSGWIPVVIGGGNDQSYPNAKALMEAVGNGKIAVVNIDAHLDARPLNEGKCHSGSPFRQLLEDPQFEGKFVEFATQGSQNSKEHVDYVIGKGAEIYWLNQLRRNNSVVTQFDELLKGFGQQPIFVSFDIDAIKSSDCPGVSCPAVIGLTAEEALDICHIAGKNPNVMLMDLSEYNPLVEELRTGKLLTQMIWQFGVGVAERNAH